MTDSSPPGKRIGKGMLITSWLLALAGLTLYFSQREERNYNPNQSLEGLIRGDVIEVQLQRNRFGHYVATGTINNQPVTFMLDTGATHVAVPAHLQRHLNLERGAQFPVMTANGSVNVWATRIQSLNLGPIKLLDIRASLNPGMQGDEILLGMSVLKSIDFSQNGDILTLKQYAN